SRPILLYSHRFLYLRFSRGDWAEPLLRPSSEHLLSVPLREHWGLAQASSTPLRTSPAFRLPSTSRWLSSNQAFCQQTGRAVSFFPSRSGRSRARLSP